MSGITGPGFTRDASYPFDLKLRLERVEENVADFTLFGGCGCGVYRVEVGQEILIKASAGVPELSISLQNGPSYEQ